MMGGVEESIYNIVPPEAVAPIKPPMHVSKHNGKGMPTASTFGLRGTSVPGVSNLAGSTGDLYKGEPGPHGYRKSAADWGPPMNTQMPDPKAFLKGGQKMTTVPSLKELKKTSPEALATSGASKMKIKPPLPDKKDVPIMNLVSSKNFIVSNAVENILMAPKKSGTSDLDYGNKEDYGKVPAYLESIKADVAAEKQLIAKMIEEEQEAAQTTRPMSDTEREGMLAALKAKWQSVNTAYQARTHLTKLDTIGKVKSKEYYEKEMKLLEGYIGKLQRQNIVVDSSK